MVMDRLFLYIFTTACVCGTLSIFLYAPSLYDPREPLNTEEATDCTYWRWHGYIRLCWDSLVITNNLNNYVRESFKRVHCIVRAGLTNHLATNCFTLRKLNCSWRKKWRRVGGCPDMSGGGSADILFPLVHNPCLLPSLENLEKNDTWSLILNMNKFYFATGSCLYFTNECIYCGSYICK